MGECKLWLHKKFQNFWKMFLGWNPCIKVTIYLVLKFTLVTLWKSVVYIFPVKRKKEETIPFEERDRKCCHLGSEEGVNWGRANDWWQHSEKAGGCGPSAGCPHRSRLSTATYPWAQALYHLELRLGGRQRRRGNCSGSSSSMKFRLVRRGQRALRRKRKSKVVGPPSGETELHPHCWARFCLSFDSFWTLSLSVITLYVYMPYGSNDNHNKDSFICLVKTSQLHPPHTLSNVYGVPEAI